MEIILQLQHNNILLHYEYYSILIIHPIISVREAVTINIPYTLIIGIYVTVGVM